MGQSTDAILCYGIPLEFEDQPYSDLPFSEGFEDEEEFDDFVLRDRLSLVDPHFPYKDTSEILNACPFELVRHCSCDYPMYIFALKDLTIHAHRGYLKQFDTLPVPNAEGLRILEMYARHFGFYQKPQWILCSDWC